MRASMHVSVTALLGLGLGLTGCAGKVNFESLASIKRVGLLTVTMDKVGLQESDADVMRQVATHAAGEYARVLAQSQSWTLVPPGEYQGNPRFQGMSNLGQSEIVREQLQKMADNGTLKPADPAAAMAYMKAQ